MKLQVITTFAVISGIFSTTHADAGKFDLGQALRTAQTINRTVNNVKHNSSQKIAFPSPNPPVYKHPVIKPIHRPLPHPGHGHVHKPICHKPICKPPVNRPPKKCYTLKLINNAEAEVYYVLNEQTDFSTMPVDDVDWIKSMNPAPHTISYHNGQEEVEYELDPNGIYSFEWQGETLQLLEVQG